MITSDLYMAKESRKLSNTLPVSRGKSPGNSLGNSLGNSNNNVFRKVALISGGTSGIGKAFVLRLLEDGLYVACFSRDKRKCEILEKELGEFFDKERFMVLKGDVTEENSIRQVVAEVVKRFKHVDVLINNAGKGYYVECDTVDESKLSDLIRTNIIGAMLLTKHVVPHMKKQSKGHIINIASISGKSAFPRGEFYSATKYAIMGYTEGLRKELREYGIRVSTICPGMIKTEFFGKDEIERRKKLWSGNLPVMMEPEDIAKVISLMIALPNTCEIRDIDIMPFPFYTKLE